MSDRQPRAPRLRHEVMVQITSSQGVFTGWGTNLSPGGVCVNAQRTLPLDTQVDILLQLPGQPECKLRGRVAWSKGAGPDVDEPGLGVQFLEPDAGTARVIATMIERLSADLAAGTRSPE
ncbi:MAG: hypothetical protein NVSMB23_23750 [Myxococcales bacterium]